MHKIIIICLRLPLTPHYLVSAHLGRLVEVCASMSVFDSSNHCVDQVSLIVCDVEGFVIEPKYSVQLIS